MDTGDQNILHIQHRLTVSDDLIAIQTDSRLTHTGEVMGDAVALQFLGNGIVTVQNQQIGFLLEAVNILLCPDIFIHILVDIQMVGGKVGDHRAAGAVGHVHQLEGAELHHRKVRFLHLTAQRQQGSADVAAQPDGIPLSLQHFGNQRGGRGLSVRTGDSDQRTGADLKKSLHLTGDFGTTAAKRLQRRIGRMHTGGAEHQICLKIVQVAIAHTQGAAQLFQLQHFLLQLLSGSSVTAGNSTAKFQQQPHQRTVTDPKTQYGDLFIFQ